MLTLAQVNPNHLNWDWTILCTQGQCTWCLCVYINAMLLPVLAFDFSPSFTEGADGTRLWGVILVDFGRFWQICTAPSFSGVTNCGRNPHRYALPLQWRNQLWQRSALVHCPFSGIINYGRDMHCPFSSVTNCGRVWRKRRMVESEARCGQTTLTVSSSQS